MDLNWHPLNEGVPVDVHTPPNAHTLTQKEN